MDISLGSQVIEEVIHPERLEEEEGVEESFKPPLKMKIICGYLYFIQGVLLSLPSTMPLVYETLPGYSVLSLFSAAALPFSFKFLEGIVAWIQPPSSKNLPMSTMESEKLGLSSVKL